MTGRHEAPQGAGRPPRSVGTPCGRVSGQRGQALAEFAVTQAGNGRAIVDLGCQYRAVVDPSLSVSVGAEHLWLLVASPVGVSLASGRIITAID
jgi:hypothetical protein